ncbi:MAG: amidase [Spirochaetota bacterium]
MQNELIENKSVSAFCNDALATMDAVELCNSLKTKKVHSQELVAAAIARAEKVNPVLNGIIAEMYAEARKKSQQKSTFFLRLPYLIKDNESSKGFPAYNGSRATPKRTNVNSSKFVQLQEKLGLISIGKTNLPEFGLTATTEPLSQGATVNPWNTDYIAGGSSGGSAAMVAAGVVPIAHANDGGGSIRIPAACCGLVGLKPSRGRLTPISASTSLPIDIVCQGIVSRTVRDTALYYYLLEKVYPAANLPKIGQVEHPGKKRLRIGLFVEAENIVSCHPEIRLLLDRVGKMCEQLGHKVDMIPAPVSRELGDDFLLHWSYIAFLLQKFGHLFIDSRFAANRLEPFTIGLSEHFQKNCLSFPLALFRLWNFSYQYRKLFSKVDILLTPTMAQPVPKLGYIAPEVEFSIAMERLRNFVPYTFLQNIAGAPAISLPLGQSSQELPMGVQFAAAVGKERQLLEIAFEMEEAFAGEGFQSLAGKNS